MFPSAWPPRDDERRARARAGTRERCRHSSRKPSTANRAVRSGAVCRRPKRSRGRPCRLAAHAVRSNLPAATLLSDNRASTGRAPAPPPARSFVGGGCVATGTRGVVQRVPARRSESFRHRRAGRSGAGWGARSTLSRVQLMARRTAQSVLKRTREQALREKRELKQAKRDARAARRRAADPPSGASEGEAEGDSR